MPWLSIALVAAALVVWYEVPRMVRKGQRRELWLFFLLMAFGLTLSTAQSLRLNIPNPLDWITAVYRPVSTMIGALLG